MVTSEIPSSRKVLTKLIARVGGQGIFRHQLLGKLRRKVLIDTTLDVDFSKLIKLKLNILAQFPAFAREIPPVRCRIVS